MNDQTYSETVMDCLGAILWFALLFVAVWVVT